MRAPGALAQPHRRPGVVRVRREPLGDEVAPLWRVLLEAPPRRGRGHRAPGALAALPVAVVVEDAVVAEDGDRDLVLPRLVGEPLAEHGDEREDHLGAGLLGAPEVRGQVLHVHRDHRHARQLEAGLRRLLLEEGLDALGPDHVLAQHVRLLPAVLVHQLTAGSWHAVVEAFVRRRVHEVGLEVLVVVEHVGHERLRGGEHGQVEDVGLPRDAAQQRGLDVVDRGAEDDVHLLATKVSKPVMA